MSAEVHLPLPEARPNPAAAEADAAMWRWLDDHGLCATPEARHNVRHTDNALCIALYFPQAPADVLCLITEFTGWTLLVDEGFDAGPARLDPGRCAAAIDDFVTVLDGGPPGGAMAEALAEVWPRIAAGRSPGWRTVFRNDMVRWLWGFHAEAVDRVTGHVPSLPEYLDHRRAMFGVPYYLHLCEPAVGADLPDQVRRLPAMTALRNAAADSAALWNDVCSHPREKRLGYSHNAVLLIQHHDQCDIGPAVARTVGLMNAATERMVAARNRVPAELSVLAVSDRVHDTATATADAYLAAVRGNYDYHRGAVRYTELDHIDPADRTYADHIR